MEPLQQLPPQRETAVNSTPDPARPPGGASNHDTHTPPPAPEIPSSRSHQRPKLLDHLRAELRVRHYSLRTEQVYAEWVRRFILHNGTRHPAEMGAEEVAAFLSYLASERNVAASTQNQAKSAILFLYSQVLKVDLPWLSEVIPPTRTADFPWC